MGDALPVPGETVAAGDLRVTLLPFPFAVGEATVEVSVEDGQGRPVAGASVAVVARMPDMGGTQTVAAEETGAGRYEARGVALAMAGEWRLTVRVAPKGVALTNAVYRVPVGDP